MLTVATTFTFANTWLAWRLGGFQVEHPDLAVRLATDNRITDLVAGEADVAIRAGVGPWPGLEATAAHAVRFHADVHAVVPRPGRSRARPRAGPRRPHRRSR